MTVPDIRIGLLAPPPNVVMEVEYPRYLPSNVSVHTTRVPRSTSEVTAESLYEMTTNVEAAARTIAMTKPKLMVFGCTSASFIKGLGWDRQIAQRIEDVTGIPSVTTTTAVIDALATAKARKILLVTPYVSEINDIETAFLEGNGYEVVGLVAFNRRESLDIAAITLDELEAGVTGAADQAKQADAIFISCTNLRTMDRIDALEKALDRPVITSNQATVWAIHRDAGLSPSGQGGGWLLTQAGSGVRHAEALS